MKAFGPITMRASSTGQWWALNKRETGWASSGFCFDFLGEALDRFGAIVTTFGRDAFGLYLLAECRPTAPAHIFDDPANVAIARELGATTWIARTSRGRAARAWDELSAEHQDEIRVQTRHEVTDSILAVAFWERVS